MLRSFLQVEMESHFSIQNLPLGVFRPRGGGEPRIGTAIGSWIFDLTGAEHDGLLGVPGMAGVLAASSLNPLLKCGRAAWSDLRRQMTGLLSESTPTLRDDPRLRDELLFKQADVEMLLPVEIGNYTDFYSSREHAMNIGEMLRGKENALMPNWLHLPVAYHGRASSIAVSGTDVRRPSGQIRPDDAAPPIFRPTAALDYELETGVIIGTGNALGEPIAAAHATEHIFGMVLVNDWSARDIQKWEYAPLGPFLAKNFATTISPWVVMWEALEPFLVPGPVQDPQPLEYLQTTGDLAVNLNLEVWLTPAGGTQPTRITASNMRYLYWNVGQQIAHHTITGCNLQPGDLLASGTISGPKRESRGCLLELTWGGKAPVVLTDGQERRFLADGDRVTMTGWCQGDGYRIGFGEATGCVLPAR